MGYAVEESTIHCRRGGTSAVFAPPLCPYAYKTDVVRINFDTAAAAGWNNFDAAKLFGSTDFPPGAIHTRHTRHAGAFTRVTRAMLVHSHAPHNAAHTMS